MHKQRKNLCNQIMKRITSADIAKLAGVSRSTVSRVLNNYSNVPEDTKKKVMDIVKANHYYPQMSGQLLTGKRSRTLGLFRFSSVPISNDSLGSSYMMYVIDEAKRHGYLVLTCVLDDLTDKKNIQFVRKMFMEGRIDAGIFIGIDMNNAFILELLEQGEYIGIFDYLPPISYPNLVTVNFEYDHEKKAIDYLYELGHRDIAILDGDMTRLSSIKRHESYFKSMQEHNIPLRSEWLAYAGITQDEGYLCAKKMLSDNLGHLPSVICANNDCVAFGVYQALWELGISIGDRVSVIGNDGHEHNQFARPPLTSIEFDLEQIFSSLVSKLIDVVENEGTGTNLVFTGELVIRGSCKKLN